MKEANELENGYEPIDPLLKIEVKDEEISELLEMLAASDAMVQAPISTVRDLTELTEKPPTQIVKLLAELRSSKTSESEEIHERLDRQKKRIDHLDSISSVHPKPLQINREEPLTRPERALQFKSIAGLLLGFGIVALIWFILNQTLPS